jgi:hypothetical protein
MNKNAGPLTLMTAIREKLFAVINCDINWRCPEPGTVISVTLALSEKTIVGIYYSGTNRRKSGLMQPGS